MNALNVCYLLESTELSGGVRVVFDQARALAARGHRVSVLALRGDHAWYPYPVTLSYVGDFAAACASLKPDVVIATFWTTVAPALACKAALRVHLCQGCEWECPEYDAIAPDILAAYDRPVPKLTVGPWLDDKLRSRFGADRFPVACVGQCVDAELNRPAPFWRAWLKRERTPRVLVPGLFEAWVKGVKLALEAIERLRKEGRALHVVRVSSLPQNPAENGCTAINEYHQAIAPTRMAELYRSADVVMTPSYDGEGFGLPFAEALASGTAAIATEIPPYLAHDARRDYARFVPQGDTAGLTAALRELLDDPAARRRMARRGRAVMRGRYGADAVGARIEATLREWLDRG